MGIAARLHALLAQMGHVGLQQRLLWLQCVGVQMGSARLLQSVVGQSKLRDAWPWGIKRSLLAEAAQGVPQIRQGVGIVDVHDDLLHNPGSRDAVLHCGLPAEPLCARVRPGGEVHVAKDGRQLEQRRLGDVDAIEDRARADLQCC